MILPFGLDSVYKKRMLLPIDDGVHMTPRLFIKLCVYVVWDQVSTLLKVDVLNRVLHESESSGSLCKVLLDAKKREN
jgi:hypothetical protein